MTRVTRRLAAITGATVLLLLALTGTARAASKTAEITSLQTTAVVDEMGAISVDERTQWTFKGGDFSRVQRDLKLLGGQTLESWSVGEIVGGAFVEYKPGVKGSRVPGTYSLDGGEPLFHLEIYYSASSGQSKTFSFRYKVSGAVIAYSDTAEISWFWVGAENLATVKSLRATMTIPASSIPQDEFRVWGHGPLTGSVHTVSNHEAVWEATNISPGTFVDGRAAFPPQLVPGAPQVGRPMLQQILAEEQRNADEANRKREEARRKTTFDKIGTVAVALISAAVWLFLFFAFGKEYQPSVDVEYVRELPAQYSPAVLGYLWKWGSTGPTELAAVVVDLARRGYLRIEQAGSYDPGILQSDKPDFRFVWLGQPKQAGDQLNAIESVVSGYLFNSVGMGAGQVYQSQIYTAAKSTPHAFMSFMNDFRSKIKEAAEAEGFVESSSLAVSIIGVALGILTIAVSMVFFDFWFKFIGLAVGIVEVLFAGKLKRRTRKGRDQYELWDGFRRFLKDFSLMPERAPTDVILWEHYLVYAIPLGVAAEVVRQLQYYLPPEQQQQFGSGWLYSPYGATYGLMGLTDISSGFESAASIAHSETSSGSGGGGGFSGGGGGGGGGGGYSAD